jgi:signal transduction histidine kinase
VQLIAAVTQMLDAAHAAFAGGDSPAAAAIVGRAMTVAHEANVDLREIVSGIEPHALSELGLAAAITELTQRHNARRGVAFDLDLAGSEGLGDGAQSGLYQIVRDALDQAVRRGPPTKVAIAIAPSGGGVELRIADDGGEERREAVLAALAGRAAELNGTFMSETTPAGTAITIRLPPSAAQL